MAGWQIPYQWRFIARKITYFYGPFSSQPCWITGWFFFNGDSTNINHKLELARSSIFGTSILSSRPCLGEESLFRRQSKPTSALDVVKLQELQGLGGSISFHVGKPTGEPFPILPQMGGIQAIPNWCKFSLGLPHKSVVRGPPKPPAGCVDRKDRKHQP